ncbi:MAG: alpha/beta hydrolase [Desulfovibrio sp.]|nr:alpha/beta hydrolase [Desulfovibrio sp.]
MALRKLNVPTQRGVLLNGVLFTETKADTVVVAITGIHGNFYSNPFYYNFGQTLNAGGVDFIYAQTNDAFGRIQTHNVKTGKEEVIGSWNENFDDTDDDVGAYVRYAFQAGYRHIILAGHSLGANKIIHYLAQTHDPKVEHFILLSPANITWLTSQVTEEEKDCVRRMVGRGQGQEMLPFPLLGWIDCVADTAWQWLFTDTLNNVHVEADKDFSQVARMTHSGALLIGTYDNFTYGDPAGFLRTINSHMPTAQDNTLIFIQKTGHTYQQKEQEVADHILRLVQQWRQAEVASIMP